jgi:hypothetical protein
MPNNRGGLYSCPHPTLCQYVMLIKYMGDYLCMSIIIRTFVLSMVIPTTGSRGGQLLAEGRLQPAYNNI